MTSHSETVDFLSLHVEAERVFRFSPFDESCGTVCFVFSVKSHCLFPDRPRFFCFPLLLRLNAFFLSVRGVDTFPFLHETHNCFFFRVLRHLRQLSWLLRGKRSSILFRSFSFPFSPLSHQRGSPCWARWAFLTSQLSAEESGWPPLPIQSRRAPSDEISYKSKICAIFFFVPGARLVRGFVFSLLRRRGHPSLVPRCIIIRSLRRRLFLPSEDNCVFC